MLLIGSIIQVLILMAQIGLIFYFYWEKIIYTSLILGILTIFSHILYYYQSIKDKQILIHSMNSLVDDLIILVNNLHNEQIQPLKNHHDQEILIKKENKNEPFFINKSKAFVISDKKQYLDEITSIQNKYFLINIKLNQNNDLISLFERENNKKQQIICQTNVLKRCKDEYQQQINIVQVRNLKIETQIKSIDLMKKEINEGEKIKNIQKNQLENLQIKYNQQNLFFTQQLKQSMQEQKQEYENQINRIQKKGLGIINKLHQQNDQTKLFEKEKQQDKELINQQYQKITQFEKSIQEWKQKYEDQINEIQKKYICIINQLDQQNDHIKLFKNEKQQDKELINQKQQKIMQFEKSKQEQKQEYEDQINGMLKKQIEIIIKLDRQNGQTKLFEKEKQQDKELINQLNSQITQFEKSLQDSKQKYVDQINDIQKKNEGFNDKLDTQNSLTQQFEKEKQQDKELINQLYQKITQFEKSIQEWKQKYEDQINEIQKKYICIINQLDQQNDHIKLFKNEKQQDKELINQKQQKIMQFEKSISESKQKYEDQIKEIQAKYVGLNNKLDQQNGLTKLFENEKQQDKELINKQQCKIKQFEKSNIQYEEKVNLIKFQYELQIQKLIDEIPQFIDKIQKNDLIEFEIQDVIMLEQIAKYQIKFQNQIHDRDRELIESQIHFLNDERSKNIKEIQRQQNIYMKVINKTQNYIDQEFKMIRQQDSEQQSQNQNKQLQKKQPQLQDNSQEQGDNQYRQKQDQSQFDKQNEEYHQKKLKKNYPKNSNNF